jgi:glutaredoxin
MNKNKKFIIYGASFCSWCAKAKEHAEEKEVEYTYVDLGDIDDVREWAGKRGLKSIPQVYTECGDHVGGHDQFKNYLKEA